MNRRTAIRAAPFCAWALLALLQDDEPYQWGHRLTPACSWRAETFSGLFGSHEPDMAALRAEYRCQRGRGAHAPGPIPVLNVLLPRFPSSAELAAWETTDEDRDPFPAR